MSTLRRQQMAERLVRVLRVRLAIAPLNSGLL